MYKSSQLGVYRYEEEREYSIERGISRFRVWIQRMGKHGMFQEPNYMLFYIRNIFYIFYSGRIPFHPWM